MISPSSMLHPNLGLLLWTLFVPLIAISIAPCRINCQQTEDVSITPSEYLWKVIVDIPSPIFQRAFLPTYFSSANILQNDELSLACKTDLQRALDGLEAKQNWAVSLFNAWGKFPPSGIARGTLTDFGDYDQCLDVGADDHTGDSAIPQYCLLDISMPMPPMPKQHNYFHKSAGLIQPQFNDSMNGTLFLSHIANEASVFYWATIQLGICLPASCSDEDIEQIAEKNVNKLGLGIKNIVCETKSTGMQFNYVQISAIIFLTFMFTLTFAAAIYDRVTSKNAKIPKFSVLLWFSPARNIRKLLRTKMTKSDELACVHGLRFISIVWVVVGHTLEWNNLNIFRDTFLVKEHLSSIGLQFMFKAPYAVETFYYLSGLLTSYITLKFTDGQFENFDCRSFFVFRYLRLTPQLGVFLLLTSLLPPMFDGPIWKSYMSKIVDNCSVTWWHNLVYLQNFIDFEHICSIHTWFLASDMQLHWMSIIPVIILLINRRNGIIFTKCIIVLCACLSAIKVFVEKFPPDTVITSKTDFRDENDNPSYFYYFYFKPWIHIIPFFMGFIFGAKIVNLKAKQKNWVLKKSTKYLLWLAIFSAYLFEIFNTVPYLRGRPYDPLWSAIWFPLNRAVWAAILSSMIWMCITNNGGVVGRVLSWSGFKPLSRLTYSVYLTHAWTLWIALGSRRDLIDTNMRSILVLCGGILLSAYVVGFVFTVVFESPLFHLMEYMKHRDDRRKITEIEEVCTGDSVLYVINGNPKNSSTEKISEEMTYVDLIKSDKSDI